MRIDTKPVKQWIRENIEQLRSREEIARKFGFSPRMMEKLFRQEEGVTLTEYIKREKYRRARHLLESTDLCCYEIGLRLGLGTAESMAKAFRRRYGLTMREYRTKYR